MRRQCRRFEFQRILLPVRMRIHWGMGRFWAIFLASVRFVRKVLWDGCGGARRVSGLRGAWRALGSLVCVATRRRASRAALFGVGRVRRPAAPLGRGARKSLELLAMKQQFVSRCGL